MSPLRNVLLEKKKLKNVEPKSKFKRFTPAPMCKYERRREERQRERRR